MQDGNCTSEPQLLNKTFSCQHDIDLDFISKTFKKSAIVDIGKAREDEMCGRQPRLYPPHARCVNGWLKVIARDRTARKTLASKLARLSGNTSKVCFKFLEALPKAVASVLRTSGTCLIPRIVKIKSTCIRERPPGASKSILGRKVRLHGFAAHCKPKCKPTRSFNAAVLKEDDEQVTNSMANEVMFKFAHAFASHPRAPGLRSLFGLFRSAVQHNTGAKSTDCRRRCVPHSSGSP